MGLFFGKGMSLWIQTSGFHMVRKLLYGKEQFLARYISQKTGKDQY